MLAVRMARKVCGVVCRSILTVMLLRIQGDHWLTTHLLIIYKPYYYLTAVLLALTDQFSRSAMTVAGVDLLPSLLRGALCCTS